MKLLKSWWRLQQAQIDELFPVPNLYTLIKYKD